MEGEARGGEDDAEPTIRRKAKYIYGNYPNYYGYRVGGSFVDDSRFPLLRRQWFEGRDCIDVGCNDGTFTIGLALHYNVSTMLGIDIDKELVKAAKRHLVEALSAVTTDRAHTHHGAMVAATTASATAANPATPQNGDADERGQGELVQAATDRSHGPYGGSGMWNGARERGDAGRGIAWNEGDGGIQAGRGMKRRIRLELEDSRGGEERVVNRGVTGDAAAVVVAENVVKPSLLMATTSQMAANAVAGDVGDTGRGTERQVRLEQGDSCVGGEERVTNQGTAGDVAVVVAADLGEATPSMPATISQLAANAVTRDAENIGRGMKRRVRLEQGDSVGGEERVTNQSGGNIPARNGGDGREGKDEREANGNRFISSDEESPRGQSQSHHVSQCATGHIQQHTQHPHRHLPQREGRHDGHDHSDADRLHASPHQQRAGEGDDRTSPAHNGRDDGLPAHLPSQLPPHDHSIHLDHHSKGDPRQEEKQHHHACHQNQYHPHSHGDHQKHREHDRCHQQLQHQHRSFHHEVQPPCVRFVCRNVAESGLEENSADTITCLSVTKWVHLNCGDAGLLKLFSSAFHALRPGGLFLLEPQPWKSYKRYNRISPAAMQHYGAIKIFPNMFREVLLDKIGFRSVEEIVPRRQKDSSSGFNRPLLLFHK